MLIYHRDILVCLAHFIFYSVPVPAIKCTIFDCLPKDWSGELFIYLFKGLQHITESSYNFCQFYCRIQNFYSTLGTKLTFSIIDMESA